jgi:hypothetical protein
MLISIIRNNKRVKSRSVSCCCYTNHCGWCSHSLAFDLLPGMIILRELSEYARARLAGIILIVNVIIINRSVTMGTDKSKTHTHTHKERNENAWRRIMFKWLPDGYWGRKECIYVIGRRHAAEVRLCCVCLTILYLWGSHIVACNISRPCVYNNRRSLTSKYIKYKFHRGKENAAAKNTCAPVMRKTSRRINVNLARCAIKAHGDAIECRFRAPQSEKSIRMLFVGGWVWPQLYYKRR